MVAAGPNWSRAESPDGTVRRRKEKVRRRRLILVHIFDYVSTPETTLVSTG